MKPFARSRCAIAVTALLLSGAAAAATTELVEPSVLVVDKSLTPKQQAMMETVARRYDTFWHTGEERLAREALADNFVDKTPPEGRKQGPEGPLLASRAFRAAVPDLSCAIEQLIIAGDRAVVHLHFRGHFTGTFGQRQGSGQAVDFIATDIYQIDNGKIAANWHIEDNLTLMKQLGAL
ncbi:MULTISPECIES: ester cyclase [Pseudomonas]|jgi:predicted ester cyclase|uniref:ester cyclase n=1 Tax=Pseudomonas TaxID=286 RepID=UPI00054C19EC|nr:MULTISPECIES: ester cyclase [Pseudomonas]MBB4813860.1 putative ester cyclase [Pseudomonas rhodesiae]MBX4135050.1 ester cyclase [Pseudomonas sp. S5F11]MDN6864047.1 ester cyclase [Pseudomonas rhodesiae]NMZ16979.1 ester cyclase [Pseudomonas rhodesiae]PHN42383.1 ester cyclase [Pseudomonas sp. ICMP 564]